MYFWLLFLWAEPHFLVGKTNVISWIWYQGANYLTPVVAVDIQASSVYCIYDLCLPVYKFGNLYVLWTQPTAITLWSAKSFSFFHPEKSSQLIFYGGWNTHDSGAGHIHVYWWWMSVTYHITQVDLSLYFQVILCQQLEGKSMAT